MFEARIRTEGEVFAPDPRPEIVRILRYIADDIEAGQDASHFLTVCDINGNDVGRYRLRHRVES